MSISFNNEYCISSVYLPTRSGCTDNFKESLDSLSVIAGKYIGKAIFLGDFNADPGGSLGFFSSTILNEQGRILVNFLKQWNYTSVHLCLNTPQILHTLTRAIPTTASVQLTTSSATLHCSPPLFLVPLSHQPPQLSTLLTTCPYLEKCLSPMFLIPHLKAHLPREPHSTGRRYPSLQLRTVTLAHCLLNFPLLKLHTSKTALQIHAYWNHSWARFQTLS